MTSNCACKCLANFKFASIFKNYFPQKSRCRSCKFHISGLFERLLYTLSLAQPICLHLSRLLTIFGKRLGLFCKFCCRDKDAFFGIFVWDGADELLDLLPAYVATIFISLCLDVNFRKSRLVHDAIYFFICKISSAV